MVKIHTYDGIKEKHEIKMTLTICVEDDPTLEEVLARIHDRLLDMKCFKRKDCHEQR